MRRWNGWGDSTVMYPLPPLGKQFLEARLGPGVPPADASLTAVLSSVPAPHLPKHPLIATDALDRLRHARGQSLPDWIALRSGRIPAFPDGVAYPLNRGDVQTLIRYAVDAGVRLIPYGGGTSVVGHINPLPGDAPVVTVDMGRMNQLQNLDETSLLATFGAGVSGPELEAHLRARGFTLGHYPQSFEYSTLGGWIATRSTGQQSIGYGRIERLFAGGHVESPAGPLDLRPVPASAAGPDLRELVLGSEGRLGFITEAAVRVTPLPEMEAFHTVFLPDWDRALQAARTIAQAGLPLSLMRLSTPTETETTLALAGHERLIRGLEQLLSVRRVQKGKCMLLLGFTGRSDVVKAARRAALSIARRFGGVHVGQTFGKQWRKTRFRTPYLRNTLWGMGYAIDTLETAVPWDRVPATVTAIETALRGGLREADEHVFAFTHLSHLYPTGSSVYTTYLFRLTPDPDQNLQRWRILKDAASRAILELGGTISHQHGVGVDHAPYLALQNGPLGTTAIHDVCLRFDPEGVMNPGKLLEAEIDNAQRSAAAGAL